MIDLAKFRSPQYTARVFLFESENPIVRRTVEGWRDALRARRLPCGAEVEASLYRQAVARVTGLPLEIFEGETVEIVTLPDGSDLPGEKPAAKIAPWRWVIRERGAVTLADGRKVARLTPGKDTIEPLPGAGRFERLSRLLVLL